MAESTTEIAGRAIRFERAVTIDEGFANRFATALLVRCWLMPRNLRSLAITLVAFVVGLGLLTWVIDPTGTPIARVVSIVGGLCFFIAVYLFLLLRQFLRAQKQLREQLPPGSTYTIALSDDSLRVVTPLFAVDYSYRLFRSLRRYPEVIALTRERVRDGVVILPSDVFTTESLDWLEARLGRAA